MNPLQIVYSVIGLVLVAGIGTYIYKCESAMTFAERAAILAEDAKKKAEKRAADDRKSKEKADAENKRLVADNAALSKRLSSERARSRFLSQPAPASRRPDLACFAREDFERATRQLDKGLSGLAERCDEGAIALQVARQWSNTVLRQHQSE